jgi:hypothetical protein
LLELAGVAGLPDLPGLLPTGPGLLEDEEEDDEEEDEEDDDEEARGV